GYHSGKARRIVSNYKVVVHDELPYLTDAFGDEATAFIERNRDKPFLLYLAFNAPHGPLQAKPDYLKKYQLLFDNGMRAANAALTQSMDENIGKVLAALRRLKLEENTLVIFTNDNGGAANQNGASNYPLRGAKGSVLEGGLKVPLIIRWPGKVAAGMSVDHLVSTLDVLPTVVHAIGAQLPNDRVYDGVDLIPYLRTDNTDNPHDTLYWRVNWAAAIRHQDWKLIRTPRNETLLFDIGNDPGESRDLKDERTDIAQALSRKLNLWESQMNVPLWHPDPKWKKFAEQIYN
ncbi:MAG: sulfatase-like hydrolase/transferase, partial [Gammaproteobacteria bacterium]|nr:sulfatase-like hydrolase/transferase [Gammaproteobacteria bacterium]